MKGAVVADRLLVDLDAMGRASVSAWLDGEWPRVVSAPVALTPPLNSGELTDLCWYLEDYLRMPFGVDEQRGLRIAERLPEWGQAMFTALFGQGPGRDAYLAVRTRGSDAELVVRSTDLSWLSLPWELLHDPDLPAPLALNGMVLSRALSIEQQEQPVPSVGGADVGCA